MGIRLAALLLVRMREVAGMEVLEVVHRRLLLGPSSARLADVDLAVQRVSLWYRRDLNLELISRPEVVDGTISDPFWGDAQAADVPKSGQGEARRILCHGSQLEVGNTGTDSRVDLRQEQYQAR